jgi:hypothetical protein
MGVVEPRSHHISARTIEAGNEPELDRVNAGCGNTILVCLAVHLIYLDCFSKSEQPSPQFPAFQFRASGAAK